MTSSPAGALARGTAPATASGPWWASRAEIDTSAPFESVKEAVDRFGGSGLWKTSAKQQQQTHQMLPVQGDGGIPPPPPLVEMTRQACPGEAEDVPSIKSVESQTALLEKDLAVKERETLQVLKELEMTKRVLDGLKLRLQKHELETAAAAASASAATGASATSTQTKISESSKIHPISDSEQGRISAATSPAAFSTGGQTATPSPGLILKELKQAKLNLTRTTSDLAGIRSSTESLNTELQREKLSLETARQRLSENTSLVSHLEAELTHTRMVLQLVKEVGIRSLDSSSPHVSRKLHEIRSESEQFKRTAEAAGSEVSKLMAEIDKTKGAVKMVELRLLAARKVEEAARATEAAATADIKAVMKSEGALPAEPAATDHSNPAISTVTLSVEEYNNLIQRALEAEAQSKKKIEAAVAQVEEANRSKAELMNKVDEAKSGVKMRKKVLSEALCRVEVANKGKLAVEEALRKWRSEGHRRRSSVHNSPRFKTSSHPPAHRRKNSKTQDPDHLFRAPDVVPTITTPTLSIGQILSRKLMGPEDFAEQAVGGMILNRENDGPKMSLGQMLSRRHGISSSESNGDEGMLQQQQHDPLFPVTSKTKRFAFVGFPLILAAKQNRKNKKKKRRQQQQLWSSK